MTFISQCECTRRRIYQAPPAACRSCALRDQCTTSARGRRIGRSLDEAYLERVRAYQDTEPYAKALRKRQVWVEPLFAEAKDWHGLRRFRLRGLEKANSEALLIAALRPARISSGCSAEVVGGDDRGPAEPQV